MRGICEAVENSVLVASTQDGGITVNFFPGEQLNFYQDKEHKDRLMLQKGFDVTVSVTAPKFYELFKVVWKGGIRMKPRVKGMSVKHMKRLGKLLDEFDNEFDSVLEDEQREALTIMMELVAEILTSDREDEE